MIYRNKKKFGIKDQGRAYFFEDKKNKPKTELKTNLLSSLNINQKDFSEAINSLNKIVNFLIFIIIYSPILSKFYNKLNITIRFYLHVFTVVNIDLFRAIYYYVVDSFFRHASTSPCHKRV